MPLVDKAARKPIYVDAPVPEPALRREHSLTSVHQPAFERAFMRMTDGLVGRGTKKELLEVLQDVESGRATIEEAVNVVDWLNPAEPLSVKLWNMLSGSLRSAYIAVIEDAGESEMRVNGFPIKFTVEKADIQVPINPYSIRFVRTRVASFVAEISKQQQTLLRGIIADGFERGGAPRATSRDKKASRPKGILNLIEELVGLTMRERTAVMSREDVLIAAGLPDRKIKSAVKRYKNQLLRKRAKRIARTETLDAYTQGLEDSWQLAKEQGVLEPTAMKEWLEITASARTCEICRGLAGQRVPIGENFVSDIIGEVMRPPAHPSCRCSVSLVIPDDISELAFADRDVQVARNRLAGG